MATAEIVVDSQGRVVDAWYADGDREWAKVFIDALRAWRFKPATLNGDPIVVRLKISSTFRHK